MSKKLLRQALNGFLESREFYELMQAYRHCQVDATIPFESVKSVIQAAIVQPVQPAEIAAPKLSAAIQVLIAEATKGADKEWREFAEEMTTQYGFTYVDDDATILQASTADVVNMMAVLGYREGSPAQTAQPEKPYSTQQFSNLSNQAHGFAQPERLCGSDDCGWAGQSDRMLGTIGPLCPDCGETTEPYTLPPVQSVQPEQEPVSETLWGAILGAIARGWCHKENASKTMDSDLAIAIAKEVKALIAQPAKTELRFGTEEQRMALLKASMPQHKAHGFALSMAQPAFNRNFCERCGKRLGGVDSIHTCTPPVGGTTP